MLGLIEKKKCLRDVEGRKKKKAVGSQEGVMVVCLRGPGGDGAAAAAAEATI